MTSAQRAPVAYVARHSGHTAKFLCTDCAAGPAGAQDNHVDPLGGIQRGHVELFIGHLCVNTPCVSETPGMDPSAGLGRY